MKFSKYLILLIFALFMIVGVCCIHNDNEPPDEIISDGFMETEFVWSIFANDSLLYLGLNSNEVKIYDISNPIEPIEIGGFATSESPRNIQIINNYAYIRIHDQGMLIYDISDPSDPFEVSFYQPSSDPYGFSINGNYAYITCADYDFRVLDISNPYEPFEVGRVSTFGFKQVIINESNAYLLSNGSIGIFDISNPINPGCINDYFVDSNCKKFKLIDSLIYVASYTSFSIVNIQDPNTPYIMSQYTNYDSWFLDVVIANNFAFIVDYDSGLVIFDISNPSEPYEENLIKLSSLPRYIFEYNNYLYVSIEPSGLAIIDIYEYTAQR